MASQGARSSAFAARENSASNPDADSLRRSTIDSMVSTRRGLRFWLTALLALGFAAKLSAVLWALDRGFELGDEGYSLLNLNHPGDAPVVHQFYRLLAYLDGGYRFGVIGARLLRLAAELLASAVLIAGVLAWSRTRVFAPGRAPVLAFVLFCLLGTLLGAGSRSLTYNDLTNLCSYGAIGAFFFVLAAPSGSAGWRRRTLAALVAGFCNGLQLGVKFPTALALPFFAVIGLVVMLRPLPARERVRLGAIYAAGVGLAVALYLAVAGGRRRSSPSCA